MESYVLNERIKLGLLCFLLLVMLGVLALTAVNTVQAVRSFQQEHSALEAGDVHAIHPWMTIHVVSHIFQVSEGCLYSSLHVGNPDQLRHETLDEIAKRQRQPVDKVIRTLQYTIVEYRIGHLHCSQ